MTSTLLNAFYEAGDKFGNIMSYVLLFVGVILLIWVMLRYLDTSDLK